MFLKICAAAGYVVLIAVCLLMRRKRAHVGRCGDCMFCEHPSEEMQGYFRSDERYCLLDRGHDTDLRDSDGDRVTAVTARDYCSSFERWVENEKP